LGKLRKALDTIANIFRRDTHDPLLKEFYKKYKLHLLKMPREDSRIGDLYIYDGKDTLPPARITSYLDPQADVNSVNSKIESGDVSELSGKLSGKMDANAGVNLLSGFLTAIGAGAVVQEISSKYEANRLKSLQFSFLNIVRDHIDPYWFEEELDKHRFKPYNASRHEEGYAYFIVTARLRGNSIKIISYDKSGNKVDVGLEALLVGGGSFGLSTEKVSQGEVKFNGNKSLVFGVEVCEYVYNKREKRFTFKTSSKKLTLKERKGRGGRKGIQKRKPPKIERTFIGDPVKGRIFVD
jgi:hypothetical protein